MANELQVYLLDPQKYSPETIAVTFAKTSRSPESFRQIASELDVAKSSEFNEKWVVGYGHSSVAEHAVLHIAVENISRLATECLESNRLASYTEKSTRYQTWEKNAFYVPAELKKNHMLADYLKTCQYLLDNYQQFLLQVERALQRTTPRLEKESEAGYERRLRSMTTDVCRFLLPSSVLANVGMTINARALEHAITKLLSHPLQEVREVGQNIKTCATEQVPTLLKYADANLYEQECQTAFSKPHLAPVDDVGSWCRLVHFDGESEERILAASFYRYQNITYAQSLDWIQHSQPEERKNFVKELMETAESHATPLRELEHVNFTFDIVLDQGAFYEVKRHRMMTLTPQALTTALGYAIPSLIERAGLTEEYSTCMEIAKETYRKLHNELPEVAAYVVPNAFNRRFMLTANLRSLMHFMKLRSAPTAHFSVRRLALQISDELSSVLPSFSPYWQQQSQENLSMLEKTYFYDLQRR
jgi:thymidylate synthase ThyX